MADKPTEFLVLRLPVPSDSIDALLKNEVERSDLECAVSRALTGDDTTYEGMTFGREPIRLPRRTRRFCLVHDRWASESCQMENGCDTINVTVCDRCENAKTACADCRRD